ncbi:peptide MFS transporter [Francisella frigiditurris]|uniref:Amino acid/peptide transporter family protein n=2 Tax=Francisella frigiditurris TaxID=1542390 RepID=A0A1J0KRE0_9GAMM|nr:amino acid/peptide transporter family protein [Francisella frigiditurris]
MEKVLANKHPKGLWFIIAIYMWEYFSFYGMRALLILYLTQELLLGDHYSYAVYGAFASLVYMTPILGGLAADRLLGFRTAVIIGAILMACGHIIIGIDGKDLLFLGMSFIICGYGYFKSNVPCLLGQLYEKDDPKRDSAFTLLYLGGNIGSICAPVACGVVANIYGWDYGFGLAGVGMLFGLAIFLLGRKYVPKVKPEKISILGNKSLVWFILVLTIIIISVSYFALKNQYEIYLITATTIFSVIWYIKIVVSTDIKTRKTLLLTIPFLIFGILFWVFDEQMFTSVELFIERNVDTTLFGYDLPASVFVSINPLSIIIGGLFLAWVWKRFKALDDDFGRMIKFVFGFILQLISFVILIFAAKEATILGKTSAIWVIISLFFLGLSELFIDPIALSEITGISDKQHSGFLSAVYFLFTGSIAGFIASRFAQMAAFKDVTTSDTNELVTQANLFLGLFSHIALIIVGMIVFWFILSLVIRRLK